DDVEVPGWSAGGACLALTLESQLLARGDAGRDLHGELPLTRHLAGAAARRTRLGDDPPDAPALRAGSGHREEALLEAHLALPAALRADTRRRAGCGARTGARVARFLPWNLNRRFGAARGLLEGDLEVVLDVRAALGTAAPACVAEQIAEPEH